MTNTTPSMRKEFESWYQSQYELYDFSKYDDEYETYINNDIDDAYYLWQACTAIMQPKIDALEADKARLIEELERAISKPVFEIRHWYKVNNFSIAMLLKEMKEGK